MKTLDELLGLAESAVDRALAAGAEAAEAYVSDSQATSLKAVGEYVSPRESIGGGVSLLVVLAGRVGIAGAHGASVGAIDAALAEALEAARAQRSTRVFRGLPEPGEPRAPTRIHAGLDALDAARIASDAETLTRAMRAQHGVSYTGVELATRRGRFAVANSAGLRAREQTASEKLILESRVDGARAQRTAMDLWQGRAPISSSFDLETIARDTVERARSALDAQPLAAPVREVILNPAAVAQIIGLVAPAVGARRLAAKQSPLAGKQGQRVAAEVVTLRDEPRGPFGSRHLAVDHEGVATQDVDLIAHGIFRGALYDHDAARAEGLASNGHGLRANVQSGVSPTAINLRLDGGDASIAELVEGAARAVVVDEPMMGGFVANKTTGDFSLVAPFAFLVEGGKIRHALPPTTVAGNAFTVLENALAFSRERRDVGSGSFPALRAGGVTCAT